MSDTISSKQNPFEAWSELVESTMKVPPPMFAPTGQVGEGEKDPWLNLIDQLWQANPYSKLLPIDPAEITHAFQQIWLDAINNPGRAWANYTNFVQQYTQLMMSASLQYWGVKDTKPVAEPEKG